MSPPAAASPWAGRRVTVMGLGLFGGGVEVARHMARAGARVTVTDQRNAGQLQESLDALAGLELRYVLGEHRPEDFEQADLVVANPGVAPSSPFLALARSAGVAITSETALFLEACPARLLLVTGTQGKSSTCSIAHQLLCGSGVPARLGGNIGRSLLGELAALTASDVVVLELSSYQLEALPAAMPAVRAAGIGVPNVLADHLERHGSVEAYEAAKRRILELAVDDTWVVLNADDPRVSRWVPARGRSMPFTTRAAAGAALALEHGRFLQGGAELARAQDLRLPGDFQRSNALCALGLALAVGAAPARLAAALPHVVGLEHRMQDLGRFAGRRVYDNGVSTTPDSTLSAVEQLEGPLTLLMGGQRKRLPLDELAATLRAREVRVLCFGASGAELARDLRAAGVRAQDRGHLLQAVEAAFEGEPATILFSPACASFDSYRNFRDRALEFQAAVARLGAARAEARP